MILIVHDARADPEGVVPGELALDREGALLTWEALLRATVAGVGARAGEKEMLAEEVEPRTTIHSVDAQPSSGQLVTVRVSVPRSMRPRFAARFSLAA